MDNETRRMLRAAFRAGYRTGYADKIVGLESTYQVDARLTEFMDRVEAAGEVEPAPEDACLRCRQPLGERVPAYVFVTEPGGMSRQTGVRVCFDCASRHGNTFTRSEFYELMEVRDNAPD